MVNATLYYFIFEIQFVVKKLESGSKAEYDSGIKSVSRQRYVILGSTCLIYLPLGTTSFTLATATDHPEEYLSVIVPLLVFNRIFLIFEEVFMDILLIKTMRYFARKKLENLEEDEYLPLSMRFALGWTFFLFLLKLMQTIFIITLGTV